MPTSSNLPAPSPDDNFMPSAVGKSNDETEPIHTFDDVKEKLTDYCRQHDGAKEKWLLSSHAHCFILPS